MPAMNSFKSLNEILCWHVLNKLFWFGLRKINSVKK